MPFDILMTGFYHFQGRDPRELVSRELECPLLSRFPPRPGSADEIHHPLTLLGLYWSGTCILWNLACADVAAWLFILLPSRIPTKRANLLSSFIVGRQIDFTHGGSYAKDSGSEVFVGGARWPFACGSHLLTGCKT